MRQGSMGRQRSSVSSVVGPTHLAPFFTPLASFSSYRSVEVVQAFMLAKVIHYYTVANFGLISASDSIVW